MTTLEGVRKRLLPLSPDVGLDQSFSSTPNTESPPPVKKQRIDPEIWGNIRDFSTWDEQIYKPQIIRHLISRESIRFPLGINSSYVPHRHRILEWMGRARQHLKISNEVFQLAVYFFDRYVNGATSLFLSDELDLYVLVCIQLSAKTLELDNHIPRSSELNNFLEKPFQLSDYARVERKLLEFFQWNVAVPVVNTFIYCFREYLIENVTDPATIVSLIQHAEYFEDLTVRNIRHQSSSPSVVASAIILSCRVLVQVQPYWPKSLEAIVGFTKEKLKFIAHQLIKSLDNDKSPFALKLHAIADTRRLVCTRSITGPYPV